MATHYDELDEIFSRGGDWLLAEYQRKHQEALTKRKEAHQLYHDALEAHRTWLESTRDAALGYGMLEDPDDADASLKIDFRLPEEVKDGSGQALPMVDQLRIELSITLQTWLRERAPKGTVTGFVLVEM